MREFVFWPKPGTDYDIINGANYGLYPVEHDFTEDDDHPWVMLSKSPLKAAQYRTGPFDGSKTFLRSD